jgi:hypothetical protein
MDVVTVLPNYQVDIPESARGIVRPGQKLQVVREGDRLVLIPFKEMREMRGFLRGIETNVERDDDRV